MKWKTKSIIWKWIWCVIKEWSSDINLYEWVVVSEDWDYVTCSVIKKSDIDMGKIERIFPKKIIKFIK